MKKYRVVLGEFLGVLIKEVTIEKETDHSVWVKGRRHKKFSSYENYFPTWRAAKKALIIAHKEKHAYAEWAVDSAYRRLNTVKNLSK